MRPPVSYMGGKVLIAKELIQLMRPKYHFYDLCCGSGAVTLALLSQTRMPVTMVDAGPWGMFWESIADRSFDLGKLEYYLDQIPEDAQGFLRELAATPPNHDAVYVFLLLQAGSFGGRPIYIKDGKWRHEGFAKSRSRKSTLYPNREDVRHALTPRPSTIYARCKAIVEADLPVTAHCMDVAAFTPGPGTVYIDPPYKDTKKYMTDFDVVPYAEKHEAWVSEAHPLTEVAFEIKRASDKMLSGTRSKPASEWLSCFGDPPMKRLF